MSEMTREQAAKLLYKAHPEFGHEWECGLIVDEIIDLMLEARAQGYASGRAQSHAVDGCPEVPLPTSERGETLQYRYGEMLKHGQSCYAAGHRSLMAEVMACVPRDTTEDDAPEEMTAAEAQAWSSGYSTAVYRLLLALREIKAHD